MLFDDAFAREFHDLTSRSGMRSAPTRALAKEGPHLKRPYADSLHGSRHSNMKELRPTVNKVEWRVAFAFDPDHRAILFAAAAKAGKKDRLVYRRLINLADARFDAYPSKARPARR